MFFNNNGVSVGAPGVGGSRIRNAYGWWILHWLNTLSNYGIQINLDEYVWEGWQVASGKNRIIISERHRPNTLCGTTINWVFNPQPVERCINGQYKVRSNGWLRIANDIRAGLNLIGSPIPVEVYVNPANRLIILEVK